MSRIGGLFARILMAMIRFYQRHISPARPPACRFIPTCSAYALEAISRFGALRGWLLAIWRVLRCNPLCKGGWDPVPERFSFRRSQLYTEEK